MSHPLTESALALSESSKLLGEIEMSLIILSPALPAGANTEARVPLPLFDVNMTI